MSFDGRGVGYANSLNTNVDTSARVHTTARTCVSLYNSLADPNMVAANKAEFRAIKEEIALGLGRPFSELGISYETRGLPPIITNVAVFNANKADDLMAWFIRFYDCRNRRERVAHCLTPCIVKGQKYYPSELYFAGIVISDGEADPMHGDTALTLMIGGKITIQNGHFAMRVNDRVQWYFDEEKEAGMFDEEGLRVKRRPGEGQGPIQYSQPTSREQKKVRDFAYAERAEIKRPARIKACTSGLDGEGATYSDVMRVFAICCSNAGPLERCAVYVQRALFFLTCHYHTIQGGYKDWANVLVRMSSWSEARERWHTGQLSAWEQCAAMLAMGQMLRMGVDATGVWQWLRGLVGQASSVKTDDLSLNDNNNNNNNNLANSDQPVRFFRVEDHSGGSAVIRGCAPLALLRAKLHIDA